MYKASRIVCVCNIDKQPLNFASVLHKDWFLLNTLLLCPVVSVSSGPCKQAPGLKVHL